MGKRMGKRRKKPTPAQLGKGKKKTPEQRAARSRKRQRKQHQKKLAAVYAQLRSGRDVVVEKPCLEDSDG